MINFRRRVLRRVAIWFLRYLYEERQMELSCESDDLLTFARAQLVADAFAEKYAPDPTPAPTPSRRRSP